MQIYKTPSLIKDCICFRDKDGFFIYSLILKKVCWLKDFSFSTIKTIKEKGFFSKIKLDTVEHPKPKVSNLMLLLGKDCPMACRYCYANGGVSKEMMSFEIANQAIISYLALKPGYPRVTLFGGGEPTLNENVIRTIVSKYDKKVFWTLTTSGIVSPTFLRWLILHGVRITFSVDGPPEIQDYLRPLKNGRKSSGIVKKSINIWRKESGKPVAIRATLTEESSNKMSELLDYFEKIGVYSLHLEALFNIGRASSSSQKMGFKRPATQGFVNSVILALNWAKNNRKKVQVGELTYFLKPKLLCYCGPIGGGTIVVNQRGQITSCSEVVDNESNFWNIFNIGKLNNSTFDIDKEKMEKISKRSCLSMPACKDCFAKYVCRGGCANKGIMETGSLFSPDPYHCDFVKTIFPLLIKRMAYGSYAGKTGGDEQWKV